MKWKQIKYLIYSDIQRSVGGEKRSFHISALINAFLGVNVSLASHIGYDYAKQVKDLSD